MLAKVVFGAGENPGGEGGGGGGGAGAAEGKLTGMRTFLVQSGQAIIWPAKETSAVRGCLQWGQAIVGIAKFLEEKDFANRS